MRARVSALITGLQSLALTLWVGSMWAVGYLVAPVLFESLPDPMKAGAIAARLFRITGYLGLACGLFLLATQLYREGFRGFRRWRLPVLGVMVAIGLVGQLGLMPAMHRLRVLADGRLVSGTAIARHFGVLHGIASTLFLADSLLGLLLVTCGLWASSGE